MEPLSRAALNIAAFITVGSLFMLAATEPGTPERVITVFTLVGGITVAVIAVIVLLYHHRKNRHNDHQRDQ